jgi:hypothetical protein
MCSGINDRGEIIDGLQCPTPNCRGFLCDPKDLKMLRNSVILFIKKIITKYYHRIYVCDDLNCPLRYGTRRIPKTPGAYCFRMGCSGKLYPEYSKDYLYKQIRYLQAVFDDTRLVKKAQKSRFFSLEYRHFIDFFQIEKVSLPKKQYHKGVMYELAGIKRTVDTLLNQCAQHWIDPIAIFSTNFATKMEIY